DKLNTSIELAKQVPVLINYTFNKKRFEKVPDKIDLALISKLEASHIAYWFPTNKLPGGYNLNQPQRSHGIKNVHHFYTRRNLLVLSAFLNDLDNISYYHKQFILGSVLPKLNKMNRYMPQH